MTRVTLEIELVMTPMSEMPESDGSVNRIQALELVHEWILEQWRNHVPNDVWVTPVRAVKVK